jgi:hypothetical protein
MIGYTIPATISSVESSVARYDAVFQAEVLPRVAHSLIVAAHIIVQTAIATVVFGIQCRRWYDAYNAASLPEMIEAPQLALPLAVEPLALPAETVDHPGRAADEQRAFRRIQKMMDLNLSKHGVLITPTTFVAPARRKPRGKKAGAFV